MRALSWTVCLVVLLVGGCLESRPRGSVSVQVLGPSYPRPRCAGGDSSLGVIHPAGDPVIGARVTLSPGGFAATTGADGAAGFAEIPEGNYLASVHPRGFAAQAVRVTVHSGRSSRARLQPAPCVATNGPHLRKGFGAPVTLTAKLTCPGWEGAALTWVKLEGPDIASSVSTWDRASLAFTTAPLTASKTLPNTPRKLSFSPDEAGQYVFAVTARRSDGAVAKNYAYATATDVTGGLNSVPPVSRHYFLGPKKGPWSWVVDQWPATWLQILEGATTRTPSVVVLPAGPFAIQQTIVIRDTRSNTAFNLVLGDWNMVNRDCGRSGCHPQLQQSWDKTRHATTWQKILDGELTSARAAPTESCATCHALGYDRGAKNGGYDDVADQRKTAFPKTIKSNNYKELHQDIKNVSNVYCLACHGPARVDPPVAEQPGRFAAAICAACHDRLPEQDIVWQWRQNAMSRTVKDALNGPEARPQCARCHTAQDFYYENFALGRPPSSKVGLLTCCENLEPITCQACHSPMYATNKAQVFRYGDVTTRGGLKLSSIGAGALCSTCHTTDHDPNAAATLSARLGPHSPQAELTYGRAGYALPAPGYPTLSGVACARTAGEGCVTCHMDPGPPSGQAGHRAVGGHTFRMVSSGGVQNTRPCAACHQGMTSFDAKARGDFDGDGTTEGVRQEVDGLLALLRTRLGAAIVARAYRGCDPAKSGGVWVKVGPSGTLVVTDARGFDLGDCDKNGRIERAEDPFTFPSADLTLHKAAYNVLLLEADGSRGLHNLPYTVKLLQRTLVGVSEGKGIPDWLIQK